MRLVQSGLTNDLDINQPTTKAKLELKKTYQLDPAEGFT
jgi:hypothetical protein